MAQGRRAAPASCVLTRRNVIKPFVPRAGSAGRIDPGALFPTCVSIALHSRPVCPCVDSLSLRDRDCLEVRGRSPWREHPMVPHRHTCTCDTVVEWGWGWVHRGFTKLRARGRRPRALCTQQATARPASRRPGRAFFFPRAHGIVRTLRLCSPNSESAVLGRCRWRVATGVLDN